MSGKSAASPGPARLNARPRSSTRYKPPSWTCADGRCSTISTSTVPGKWRESRAEATQGLADIAPVAAERSSAKRLAPGARWLAARRSFSLACTRPWKRISRTVKTDAVAARCATSQPPRRTTADTAIATPVWSAPEARPFQGEARLVPARRSAGPGSGRKGTSVKTGSLNASLMWTSRAGREGNGTGTSLRTAKAGTFPPGGPRG